jgi:hypothetical protein
MVASKICPSTVAAFCCLPPRDRCCSVAQAFGNHPAILLNLADNTDRIIWGRSHETIYGLARIFPGAACEQLFFILKRGLLSKRRARVTGMAHSPYRVYHQGDTFLSLWITGLDFTQYSGNIFGQEVDIEKV